MVRSVDVQSLDRLESFVSCVSHEIALQTVTGVRDVLRSVGSADVPAWALVPDGAAERLIHREASFTVFALAGFPGHRFAPHEHKMAVTTVVLRGRENNAWYREDPGTGLLAQTGAAQQSRGEVHDMAVDAIHSVFYPDPEPMLALHVYHGDLLATPRRMWDLDGTHPRPYEEADYHRTVARL